MANALIAYGNVIDAAVLSGGNWFASLPLTNLQNRIIGRVARTTNTNSSSSKFLADLGTPKSLRTVGIVNHNLSLSAKYRVRASNDPNFASSLVDSGIIDVWPPVYATSSLDWQADNWWNGRYTEKDRAGYTWTTVFSANAAIAARYWLFEFFDTDNSNGFIQMGRIFIGEAWQPTVNMSLGANISWNSGTEIFEAISGSEFFAEKRPYRVARFDTGFMSTDEAFGNAFDIKRRVGISGEVIFQWNPADTLHAIRRQFYGRLRELSAIEYPQATIASTGWEIKELI